MIYSNWIGLTVFFVRLCIDFFKKEQLFIILEFEFGGSDLENSNGTVNHINMLLDATTVFKTTFCCNVKHSSFMSMRLQQECLCLN